MSSRGARITYPLHSDEKAIKTTNKWQRSSSSKKGRLILIPEIPRREATYTVYNYHQ